MTSSPINSLYYITGIAQFKVQIEGHRGSMKISTTSCFTCWGRNFVYKIDLWEPNGVCVCALVRMCVSERQWGTGVAAKKYCFNCTAPKVQPNPATYIVNYLNVGKGRNGSPQFPYHKHFQQMLIFHCAHNAGPAAWFCSWISKTTFIFKKNWCWRPKAKLLGEFSSSPCRSKYAQILNKSPS